MAKFESLTTSLEVQPQIEEQPKEVVYKSNFNKERANNLDDLVTALKYSDVSGEKTEESRIDPEKQMVLDALRKIMEYVSK